MIFDECRNQRHYCNDEAGRDLFFIELVIDYELSWIYMTTSLNYDFADNSRFQALQSQLTDFHLSDSLRLKLIEELFTMIRALPDIEKFYFAQEFIDKNGKHVAEYSAVIESLIQHKDFPDYSVFSRSTNPFYFDYTVPFLVEKLATEKFRIIGKKYFEELVQNTITLSQEYVEWLTDKSEFFHLFLFDKNIKYDCFIMMEQSDVKLFFVRQVISG